MRRLRVPRPRWRPSVAAQVFAALMALLIGVAVLGGVLTVWHDRATTDEHARERTTAVAVAVAQAPSTIAALTSPDPTAVLLPVTDTITRAAGLDFIVVMAPDRTRYTHADTSRIGGTFTGDIGPALRGETFTETYTGSLGPSIRTVTPVYAEDGRLLGLVAAGVTRERLTDQVRGRVPTLLAVLAAGLLVAGGISLLIARRLRTQTLGLTPTALRELYEHHDAVLHALAEGMIVFDDAAPDGPAAVVNDEARRLLALPTGPVLRSDLPPSLRGDTDLVDELHAGGGRVLVANRQPVSVDGKRIGTVLTVRDRTELQDVLGELDAVRSLASALSSQAHEHANRLHTLVTMIELDRRAEAVEWATTQFAASASLLDRLPPAAPPELTALLAAKATEAATAGVELTLGESAALLGGPLTTAELLTVIGNLVDNAIDAAGADGWVEIDAGPDGSGRWAVRIQDSGPGMSAEEFARARVRGHSSKPSTGVVHGRGLGLALVDQIAARRDGTLEARRNPSTVELSVPSVRQA
ncbi:sensor histidine kinase [Gordonia hydrophobica]|uniref:histidine kinase n=1 Tax=Gordonia hydrophobica TaxID=40516 RepID=A0ABZ2U001_9ACTN|nr:ATP-binding protein [Gordonia hydrophobica]MBM7369179.1 sensor histidine kinase regulating citrate/malate metabolism [Gordonia hydrophobica]